METRTIGIELLESNQGQIAGLAKNPRKWAKHELDKLKKSITDTPELLEARGLLVYPFEGRYLVLGGNMRLEACKELGLKELPCIILPEQTSVAKLREIVIKDNGSFGEWDWDMISADWGDLALDDWGVNVPAATKAEMELNEVKEDDFNEEEEKIDPVVKPGDVWQLGRHRLMCGDSCKADDLARLMNGAKADLYLTDPPYNVDYTGGTKDALKIKNDNMSEDNFRRFLNDAFRAADPALKPGAAFYIWMSTAEEATVINTIAQMTWQFKQIIVWVKNHFVLGRQDYQWQHEPCIYGWKEGASHYFLEDRTQGTIIDDDVNPRKMSKEELVTYVETLISRRPMTTVLKEDCPQRNDLHPTMKPLKLFGRLVVNSTKEGANVLDSFGGSGSTIMVCEQMNRTAFLMELDPHYCDVIIARWEKFTGRKAVRI